MFLQRNHVYAIVNLKPVVPGHVLIIPKRLVKYIKDMTPEETIEMFSLAQEIEKKFEEIYKTADFTMAI